MDPTLVFVLRLLLVAFAVAGALELSRRRVGRAPRAVEAAGTSLWMTARRAARVVALAGIVGMFFGAISKAPTAAIVAAMAIAAGGFVLFVLLTAASWASGPDAQEGPGSGHG